MDDLLSEFLTESSENLATLDVAGWSDWSS